MPVAPQNQPAQNLRRILQDMGEVVVCLSGGVDSALLTAVAHEELGERAIALTAVSPTLPEEEAAEAGNVASLLGIRHILVDSHELQREGYTNNEGDRCFFCKTELFELARTRANELGIRWLADGTITDDLGDHRPGLRAATNEGVRHPLVEAGLDKQAVRSMAKSMGLPVWDKPSFACLGSRFPAGTHITLARIGQVAAVERALRTMGFRQFRARWHEVAGQPWLRLELGEDEISRVADAGFRRGLAEVGLAEGFERVTLDLVGYGVARGG